MDASRATAGEVASTAPGCRGRPATAAEEACSTSLFMPAENRSRGEVGEDREEGDERGEEEWRDGE